MNAALPLDRRLSPGDGLLVLSSDNRERAHVDELQYSYPLKLIVPARRFLPGMQCVYVLSYGGGLVAGDRVRLKVQVKQGTTLVMLTQGADLTCPLFSYLQSQPRSGRN